MAGKDPRSFARFQEGASRGLDRAFLFLFLGVATGGVAIVVIRNLPGQLIPGIALGLVAIALLAVAILLLLQTAAQRVRETVAITRELRTPAPPPQPTDPIPGRGFRGEAVLPGLPRSTSNASTFVLVVAVLVIVGVVAGAVDVALQPRYRTEQALLYLGLFALLGPALLVMGDQMRPIPGFMGGSPSRPVGFTEGGVEGPFHPPSAYQDDAGSVVIRSRWFGFAQARLAAPNQIPWRLLILTATLTRAGPQGATAYLSLRRAMLPVGFRGLQLSDGFLPASGVADPRFATGLIVAVARGDLVPVLWAGYRGGSRLSVVYDQLTPLGQAAVTAARIEGNSRMNRPLAGPWFIWLPNPDSPAQLAAWLQ